MSKIVDKTIKAFQSVVNSNEVTKKIDEVAEPLVNVVPGGKKLKEKFEGVKRREHNDA